jgi:hypothetical protein
MHLFVALSLELVVQDTGCAGGLAFQRETTRAEAPISRSKHILRISKPNWGNSRHNALNSSSASDRSMCDRVAQKLATGARMVVSSGAVLA